MDAWLAWLPRWEPSTHRGRVAPCRRCFGSPVLSAAGLGADVPHGVQHGLSTRIKTIVDRVGRRVHRAEPADAAGRARPAGGAQPRPQLPAGRGARARVRGSAARPRSRARRAVPLHDLGHGRRGGCRHPGPPPLSDEAKAALRQEVGLADDYANMVGREVCTILLHHRLRIQAAIGEYVEPQIEAMLEELTRSLDAPFDPHDPPHRLTEPGAVRSSPLHGSAATSKAGLLAWPGLRMHEPRAPSVSADRTWGGMVATRLPSTPPILPGLAYIRPLGSGGFADVFLYEQDMPRRNVAVKVHAERCAGPGSAPHVQRRGGRPRPPVGPSGDRHRLSGRDLGRRPSVHRDGVLPRLARAALSHRADPRRRGARGRRADGERAGVRAPRGAGPSRRQAEQHPHHDVRHPRARGLRHLVVAAARDRRRGAGDVDPVERARSRRRRDSRDDRERGVEPRRDRSTRCSPGTARSSDASADRTPRSSCAGASRARATPPSRAPTCRSRCRRCSPPR